MKIKIHGPVILSLVLHEFDTWSLTLRGGNTLRVYENRVLGEGLRGRK